MELCDASIFLIPLFVYFIQDMLFLFLMQGTLFIFLVIVSKTGIQYTMILIITWSVKD